MSENAHAKLSQDARIRAMQRSVAFTQRLKRAAAKDPAIRSLAAERDTAQKALALHQEKLADATARAAALEAQVQALQATNATLVIERDSAQAELAAIKAQPQPAHAAAPKKSAK